MLLWFVGLTVWAVVIVFASPAVDYRMVAVGAVLPLAELAVGRPTILHTLAAPAVAMGAIMLVASGRRLTQRRWLGVPIGWFVHLVLDGVWSRTALFWWPAMGLRFPDERLPELTRGGVVPLLMELIGLVALLAWWRRFRLNEPARWAQLRRTGRLGRDLLRGD